MTLDVGAAEIDDGVRRRPLLARTAGVASAGFRFGVACLACLTPITAIFVLGAIQNFMRTTIVRRAPGLTHPRRAALKRDKNVSAAKRLFSYLYLRFSEGCQALLSLALVTLPFTLLWLFSWWAGWENSFNKGYEQSWVGPTVGLTGVFVALNSLAYLPMALAHQAYEQRWQSFFQVRLITRLIAHARWHYLALAVLTVIAGLPLFAAQGLPVFIEQMIPGFATYAPEQVQEIAGRFKLLTAIYIVVALFVLRWCAARLYVRAKEHLDQNKLRSGSLAKIGWVLFTLFLWVILFGLVAQIFVAQFLNYQWWNWISHPFYLLPWVR